VQPVPGVALRPVAVAACSRKNERGVKYCRPPAFGRTFWLWRQSGMRTEPEAGPREKGAPVDMGWSSTHAVSSGRRKQSGWPLASFIKLFWA
jgi:hypothetical protein